VCRKTTGGQYPKGRVFLDTAPAAPSAMAFNKYTCFWMHDIEAWTQCGRDLCDTTPLAVIVPLLTSEEYHLRSAAWDALFAM
jgi:hypothetical protein